MKIENVFCAVVRSGFFNWDLVAIKAGAKANGFAFDGKPVTPGFTSIVQPGTALSVMLRLEDGQIAFGDCLDVILMGFAGCDPLFIAKDQQAIVESEFHHRLIGRDLNKFRPLAVEIEGSFMMARPFIPAFVSASPRHFFTRCHSPSVRLWPR